MPVVVQCFHCNAVMELDEGFRGGVCRCSGCGSLLQVPRGEREEGKRKARPAMPGMPQEPGAAVSNVTGTVTQAPARPGDQTATADTGGSSSTLRRIHQTKPVAPPPPRKSSSSKRSGESRGASATIPPPVRPHEATARRDKRFLWIAGVLCALILAVVGVLVAIYEMRGR